MSFYLKLRKQLTKSGTSVEYTPQYRLEGRARNPNNTDALAMRIADPLWMLGRQWQFGEFIAEDNGSPIDVSISFRKEKANFYSTTKTGVNRQKINGVPLEAMVESVSVQPIDLKSKVRIGKQYERLITANFSKADAKKFIDDLRNAFPLTNELWTKHDLTKSSKLDEKSERFFKLMQGRVIDGKLLLENIKDKTYPKPTSSTTFSKLKNVTTQLKDWNKNLFVEPTAKPAWDSYTLAHQFNLHMKEGNQAEDFTLSAPDYQSGHLDWYSFDKAKVKLNPANKIKQFKSLPPVNVSFASMPDKRLFSFEDSKIDLSLMDVESADLLKMMLLDFSLVSGSDWYTIPMEMDLGELCWIDKIEVKDVFGVTTVITNDGEKGAILNKNPLKVWDIFKIRDKHASTYKKEEHFLFVPPASTLRMESEPIEELLFLRDEYANMIWALERKVPDGLGKPVDGYDLHLELYGPFLPPDSEDDNNTTPEFRLANTVPSNWIPYLPFHIGSDKSNIELRRAFMMRNEAATAPTDIRPLSYLASEDVLKVREEAIPKAGVRVQLTKQRVRWTDGKTYVWMGRKVLAGKGEGNSGLRFDYLTNQK